MIADYSTNRILNDVIHPLFQPVPRQKFLVYNIQVFLRQCLTN